MFSTQWAIDWHFLSSNKPMIEASKVMSKMQVYSVHSLNQSPREDKVRNDNCALKILAPNVGIMRYHDFQFKTFMVVNFS